ncbi:MAG: hypothetical protein KDI83_00495 [Gammaproteobacteria bacterium]|nr:hypothetical protein [Gammaproteobacteria bacterium]
MPNTDMLPFEILDSEKLARAIFEPFHIKKGKLKTAAFKAPTGKRDVSVNRLRALDANACKEKAKEIESEGKLYQGFAVISAAIIRKLGSEVVDSREPPPDYYLGHADIIHSVILEKHQPAPPEFNHLLKRLVEQSKFYKDINPSSKTWESDDFSSPPFATDVEVE